MRFLNCDYDCLRASLLADNFDDLVNLCSGATALCEVEYDLAITGLQQGQGDPRDARMTVLQQRLPS